MSARCDLSDLPVEQCACRVHGPKAEPVAVETVGQPITARFPGVCVGCEEPIREGDRILRAAEPGAGYVHCWCAA